MEFSELKKTVRERVEIQETEFIKENEDALNIGFMEMNPTQRLIFSISTFKGKKYFSVRTWFQAESGEWAPTKKGINLSFDKFAEFQKMVQIFAQAIQLDQ
ncbi:MAG: transcriptional coactivator p15/PC4 family protein [Candidatus Aminicenantes bacterium]|nr:transcriptional coactivator p15/PC4 family protein [Candidatus Aminicenantes bacterium]